MVSRTRADVEKIKWGDRSTLKGDQLASVPLGLIPRTIKSEITQEKVSLMTMRKRLKTASTQCKSSSGLCGPTEAKAPGEFVDMRHDTSG